MTSLIIALLAFTVVGVLDNVICCMGYGDSDSINEMLFIFIKTGDHF